MAALFVATVLILGTDDATELALGLTFCALLVVVTLTDLERRVIPNGVLVAGAVAAVAISAIGDPSSLPDRAIAAAAAGGFLFLVALVYPRGMGMGDVKLAAVLGLYLGAAVVVALLVALLAATAVGIAGRRTTIPLGPFLALGGVVGLFAI
jgi:leader peptidase (prepilin peptidase)/N-methyltransferase